jgi:hypothetical protein
MAQKFERVKNAQRSKVLSMLRSPDVHMSPTRKNRSVCFGRGLEYQFSVRRPALIDRRGRPLKLTLQSSFRCVSSCVTKFVTIDHE